MRKIKKTANKISMKDFMKAIKKADREVQLENNIGWVATTKPHKNKKNYDRKREKKNYQDGE